MYRNNLRQAADALIDTIIRAILGSFVECPLEIKSLSVFTLVMISFITLISSM